MRTIVSSSDCILADRPDIDTAGIRTQESRDHGPIYRAQIALTLASPCYSNVMRALPVALLVTGIGLGLSSSSTPAHGAPVIKVKARTEIQLHPVTRSQYGVLVRGEVIDRITRAPVPRVPVTIQLNEMAQTAYTDNDGNFEIEFYAEDGRYDVVARFDGGDYHASSDAGMSGVDVSKRSLTLDVQAREVSYNKRAVEAVVRARTDLGSASVEVDLLGGSAQGDLVPLGKVTTGNDGRGTVTLSREEFGAPGRKLLKVSFRGSRAFNPAEAQTTFVLATQTKIDMQVSNTELAYESALAAYGSVTDDDGKGVDGGPVILSVGTRRIASTLTDEQGRFRLIAAGSEIGTGTYNVQATFEPSRAWYRKSRSDVVQVRVDKPQPVPVTYTLAAFGATALAMAAFLGLRSKPWEAWLARFKRKSEDDKPGAAQDGDQPAPLRHGLQPARPGLVSTLRRPNAFDFSGTVRDSVKGTPIPDCVIRLAHPSGEQVEHVTEADGRFEFPTLAAGEWTASASAHGYVTETFAVTIPHRGELKGARIDLLPVRERIFALYRTVAERLLPNPRLWGIWTPRQVFDYVREQRPAKALADLTDFVEENYFSQRVPDESVLAHAEQRVNAARDEIRAVARIHSSGKQTL